MGFFGLDSKDKKKDGGLSAFGGGIGFKYNGFGSGIIDHLQEIFNEYPYFNMWTTDRLDISGSTTTKLDYASQHNLVNPLAINQPTFIAVDSDFNDGSSLSYGGDDFVYKSITDYRIADTTGVIDLVFTSGSTVTGDFPIFASSADTSNSYKISLWIFNGKIRIVMRNGGSLYVADTPVIINSLQKYAISVQQDGLGMKVAVNGAFQTLTPSVVSIPDTAWFSSIPNRTNVSVGSVIQSSPFYFNGKIVFAGYRAYESDARTLELFTGF